MPAAYTYPIRVEFRDTDAAGIAHFSVFFVWMEQAEHAALRHLGLSVMDRRPDAVSWPRVAAHCDYRSPVRFEETMEVSVAIRKLGARSVTYEFDFYADERSIASGRLTTVCCQRDENGVWGAVPIPAEIARRLKQLLVVEADPSNEARS